jgi:hypothetical protein
VSDETQVWGEDTPEEEREERELIPEETWDAEVTEIERGTSKSSNKPQLTITFECFDNAGDSLGTLRTWEPMHVGFRMQALRAALGRKGDPKLSLGSDTQDWEILVGRSCRVKVKHERYNGALNHKVDKVLPALEGTQDNRPKGEDVSNEPAAEGDDLPF